MHLMGQAVPQAPPWEDGQGWRVLTPDGQVVSAGGQIFVTATFDLGRMFGVDEDQVPELGTGQER